MKGNERQNQQYKYCRGFCLNNMHASSIFLPLSSECALFHYVCLRLLHTRKPISGADGMMRHKLGVIDIIAHTRTLLQTEPQSN